MRTKKQHKKGELSKYFTKCIVTNCISLRIQCANFGGPGQCNAGSSTHIFNDSALLVQRLFLVLVITQKRWNANFMKL